MWICYNSISSSPSRDAHHKTREGYPRDRSSTMQAANLADQLLLGSANIDIMKAKIENLVKMMIGFAQKTPKFKQIEGQPKESWPTAAQLFETHSCSWEIRIVGEKGSPRIQLISYVLDCNVWILASDTEGVPIKNHMALALYENREEFVNGMLAAFPKIKDLDSWQSLLNASSISI